MQVTAVPNAGVTKTATAATKPSSSTAPDFGTVLAAVATSRGSGPASYGSQAIAKKVLAKSSLGFDSDINPKAGAGRTRDDRDPHAAPPPAADAAAVAMATPPLPIPPPVASATEAAALFGRGQVALPGTAATAFTTQSLLAAAAPADSQAPARSHTESPDSESANSGSTTDPETSQAGSPGPKPFGAAAFQEAADTRPAAASQFVSSETQFLFSRIPGLITQTAAAHPPQARTSPNPTIAADGKDLDVNRAPQIPAAPPTVPDHLGPQAMSALNPTLSKAPSLTPAAFVATLPASSGQMPAEKSPVSRVPPASQAMKLEPPPTPKVDSSPGIDQTPNQIPALIYVASDSTATEALPSESRGTAPSEAVGASEAGLASSGMSAPSSIPTPIASASSNQATSAKKPAASTDQRVAGAPEPAASREKKYPTQVQADTIPPQAGAPATAGKDSAAVATPVSAGPEQTAPGKAEQRTELPKTHQMLDSAPAGAPAAPPARIASEPGGQVQMHVGVRTTAFGTVEIHTVVQQNQVGIAIHGERGLTHWFSSEVASIASGLKDYSLNLAAVDFDNGRSGVQTAASFQQGQARRDFSETTKSGAIPVEDQDTTGEFETVEALPPELGIRLAGTRVSIRV